MTDSIMQATRYLATGLAAALLSACSATTSFQSATPATSLQINQFSPLDLNQSGYQKYPTTSFGQYHFRVSSEGGEPMYGLVPLKFNMGYLLADIMFFAPATFFNLREVYPHYEFDTNEGVVRYRKSPQDGWSTYRPSSAEAERARQYFTTSSF
jgi:hypothetical protein